jgi:threonine synthase
MSGRFVCSDCGAGYSLDERRWRCDCGAVLDIDWQACLDPARIASRKPTLWRYREAIPLPPDADVVSFDEGFTPLLEIAFDGFPVLVKQDQVFASGSYKDRGAAVLISKVAALGIREVVEDSSGNAGCAVAAYCARAGIECAIYVPLATSPGKVAQIERYGAQIHRIPGSRQDTARAVFEAAQTVYYASHSWNPFFFHGTKTFAFEVWEQLGWKGPDTVILPAGNGTLLLGAAIGFRELRDAGLIDTLPKLVAVQAEACAPLAEAWRAGTAPGLPNGDGNTMAEGIAIAAPIRGRQVIKAVRESGGAFVTVNEAQIRASLREMCRRGFYIEPTAAATMAGVACYASRAAPGEIVVSVLTGHGLKATEKMLKLQVSRLA